MSETKGNLVRVRRPALEFLLCLIGGGISLASSSNLTGYTQTFFVGNLLVENSFVLALIIILLAGMLYEKPERHTVYGSLLVVLGLNQLVILSTLFSTLPFSPLGPAGTGLVLVGGVMGLVFQPNVKTVVAESAKPGLQTDKG